MHPTKKEPLRIAVLVKRFVMTGGAERYAVEITQRLVRRGFIVDLYCCEWDPDLVGGIHSIKKVPDRWRFSSVGMALAFAWDTWQMLKGQNYDVIHSHERGFVQNILTVHTFTWKNGTKRFPPLKRLFRFWVTPRHHLYSWLENKQMKTPWLVAVSSVTQKDIEENYPNATKAEVITPGVDAEFFTPEYVRKHRDELRREARLADDVFVVLFIGNEFRRKGLDDLIPALSEKMVLLVAGRGERMNHYRNLVRKSGVDAQVRFLGATSDVQSLYAMADVVVLPSRREAFGMVVMEAMACGLPVIVSSHAGASACVRHGENGFIFSEAGQLRSLLIQCREALPVPRLASAARETATQYTWDKAVDQYAACYQVIAQSKHYK